MKRGTWNFFAIALAVSTPVLGDEAITAANNAMPLSIGARNLRYDEPDSYLDILPGMNAKDSYCA